MLLIDDEGQKLGVLPTHEALNMARERDLDLVEVAPNANPPVCRILDYGKFKYEQAKKEREAHKHQKQAQLREVRFRPKIGQHDIDVKARVARQLLQQGDKVKMSVMFRGREITHPEIGRDLLVRVAEGLKDLAIVERQPGMEGRFMNMYLAPIPQRMQPQKQKVERQQRQPKAKESADGAADQGETPMAAALKAAGVESQPSQG